MKSNPKNLYQSIKRSVTSKFIIYGVQFLALSIYARIFTPEQFGVIATLQVFVIFFQILADIGIGPAIINQGEITNTQRDGIFTVTVFVGIFLSLFFYFSSYMFRKLFHGVEYDDIIIIISASILFFSLNIVPLTTFNKDAKFLVIAKVDTIVEVFTFSIVFILYKCNFGIFALASRVFLQAFFRFLFLLYYSKNTSIGRQN